ncbi:hypothetical protein [Pararhizobium sp.]|uniref:hypothetical protein n=1 Tax=Pararhizobium sp. TaxID=1977563 RepID=UPI0027195171|nr:hypothetical protein [Pararhizobium sp.]MDO9416264.1 hypothetical protein [Pararhizobium sp.]
MTHSINSKIAAILVASAVLGGASSAFAEGDYYPGVSQTPIVQGKGIATSGVVAKVNNGGDGSYYAGVSRDPIDNISTGSIARDGQAPVVQSGGDGTYYQGVARD